jgi:hypothetical protein
VISRFLRIKAVRFAAYGIGAVAIAGSAVYAVAAATSPSPSPKNAPNRPSGEASAVCTDFIGHFTADLGTDQSKLNAAFQQAIAQTLADQVKAGKLTQQQADAIKAKLAGKQPCAIAPALEHRGGGKAAPGVYEQQLMAAEASAVGLTPDQLKADFKNGMSLSQIAAAHNVTEAQFRAKVLATMKPQLDQAVKDGKLTAAQEQKIVERIQNGPIPFWDKAPGHKPATTPAPSV